MTGPYVVSVERGWAAEVGGSRACGTEVTFRLAVSSLEEAVKVACDTAPVPPRDPMATPPAREIGETGGSVSLPDGSTVKVEAGTWSGLADEAGRPHDLLLMRNGRSNILAAWNARHAVPRQEAKG